MKRLLFIIIAVLLSSCMVKNVDIEKPDVQNASVESKITNAILVVKTSSDIDFANNMGIKNIIISSKGVRIDDKNYRTDFESLRNLDMLVRKAKSLKMNFYIEITSGPGYNSDMKNFSIFKKDSQKYYFAQMMNEIIKRYETIDRFKGVSVKFENYNVNSSAGTINYIYSKINHSNLLYNNSFGNLSSIELSSKYLNTIYFNFKSLKYPGYSMLNNSNIQINRNILLENLQKMKKQNQTIMVRVSAPWSDEHDVFLQDLYELSRILNFDIVLDNTAHLNNCPKLLKIIKKLVPVT